MLDIALVLILTGSEVQHNKFMVTVKPNHPFGEKRARVAGKTNTHFPLPCHVKSRRIVEYSSLASLENESLLEKLWFGGPAYHWGETGIISICVSASWYLKFFKRNAVGPH